MPSSRRIVFALASFAAAGLLAGPFALPASAEPVSAGPPSIVKDATNRHLEDDVTAAATRLDEAVDRAEEASLQSAEERRQRADLLGRAKDLRAEADVTLRKGASRAAFVSGIDAVTAGLLALADASVAAASGDAASGGAANAGSFGEEAEAGAGLAHPHASTTVLRFRDVAEDAVGVLPNLSEAERADVRQLVQAGDDVVALVKDTRRSDHRARTAHLRSLEDITRKLQALHQTGLGDRRKGQPFVPAWRTPDGWLPVSAESAGLKALRVSFEKPGSAWVFLENATDAPREFFAEIQFFDHVGESTGAASAENPARHELKPGEVRRVELPIIPVTARFWDLTTGFSIYVE